jgi:hypothetical protein
MGEESDDEAVAVADALDAMLGLVGDLSDGVAGEVGQLAALALGVGHSGCRVGGAPCDAPPPSEPDVPVVRASGSSKPHGVMREAVPGRRLVPDRCGLAGGRTGAATGGCSDHRFRRRGG